MNVISNELYRLLLMIYSFQWSWGCHLNYLYLSPWRCSCNWSKSSIFNTFFSWSSTCWFSTYYLSAWSKNHWYPDIADLRQQIVAHPEISGILIINPDNPTGMVYSQDVIREIVEIAKEYDLFLISDEIYSNLSYGGVEHRKLASVIWNVPGIAMRGISKEFPWPGSRCGWIEFYNRDSDDSFARYAQTIIAAKMLEVCSTTLPQRLFPS